MLSKRTIAREVLLLTLCAAISVAGCIIFEVNDEKTSHMFILVFGVVYGIRLLYWAWTTYFGTPKSNTPLTKQKRY